jgi:predicted nucleotidyltransferase
MRLDDVLAKLRHLKPQLALEAHVRSLAVFGSVVRGEATAGSDIDIIVEFDETPGFFGFAALQDRLRMELGCDVDLFTRAGLHPALRDRILAEAVDA